MRSLYLTKKDEPELEPKYYNWRELFEGARVAFRINHNNINQISTGDTTTGHQYFWHLGFWRYGVDRSYEDETFEDTFARLVFDGNKEHMFLTLNYIFSDNFNINYSGYGRGWTVPIM